MLSVTINKVFFLLAIIFILAGCQSVKPYQRAYLNDRDMEFGSTTVENMEHKAHAYREGAVGGGKGKSAGGCGCR
jgi:hypothetical protein